MIRPAPDFIDYQHLSRLVVDGVRRTASDLRARDAMSQVVGYALLPDEELGSLMDVVCHRKDAISLPAVEWSAPQNSEYFEEAKALLARRIELDNEGDYFTQNDRAFEALVRALIQVRSEAQFPPAAFFTICVADAGETREHDAIPRLNPPGVVREWRLARRDRQAVPHGTVLPTGASLLSGARRGKAPADRNLVARRRTPT